MITNESIFEEISGAGVLWCGADMDSGELARAVEFVTERGIGIISVVPNAVETVWPWLEGCDVKIMARFYLSDKRITEAQISDVTVRINSALRQGAQGAQVFVRYSALADLVEQTYVIRDDLFFNKDLSIGLDVADIGAYEWDTLYENLRKINVSSVVFVLAKEDGNKSDFVGRVYAMLRAWTSENNFDLHFALGANSLRIEQVRRLVEKLQPQLAERVKFLIAQN